MVAEIQIFSTPVSRVTSMYVYCVPTVAKISFKFCSKICDAAMSDHFLVFSGLLVSSRLVSFSSNISCRLYPQWAIRVLSLPALAKGEAYQTQDPLETTVSVCVLSQ